MLDVDLDGPMVMLTHQNLIRQACSVQTAAAAGTVSAEPSLRVTDFGVLLSNACPMAYRQNQPSLTAKRPETGHGYVTFTPLTWQYYFRLPFAPIRQVKMPFLTEV